MSILSLRLLEGDSSYPHFSGGKTESTGQLNYLLQTGSLLLNALNSHEGVLLFSSPPPTFRCWGHQGRCFAEIRVGGGYRYSASRPFPGHQAGRGHRRGGRL